MKHTIQRTRRLLVIVTSLLIFATVILMAFIYMVGVRINTSHSLAPGIYLTTNARVEKNRYVEFCPPFSELFDEIKRRHYIGEGFCPGKYGYMLKNVSAIGGDIISVRKEGVYINDALLPFSTPKPADANNLALPVYRIERYMLKDDEVLLMSDVSALSFDGRYFGPIKLSQITHVIKPLYTW